MDPEPEPLFREEALEYLQRYGGPGELLRVSTHWTTTAFGLLVVLVAVGLILTFVIQVHDEPLLRLLVSSP